MTAAEYLKGLHANRKVNLHLMGTRLVDIAEKLDWTRGYVCRLATGRTPISEKTARQIEEAFGLAFGHLDKEVS